ncbi:Uncharacterized protein TCM_019373 [Theobroma cacao]|uniref:Uncharacterized protein n=1 Tax=Theobroma cacao TaxID=3641 RepID=A0A061EGJ4_THECC|nr:Uncharacterized protein TCM_019373 [Theobroma cacao]
MVCVKSCVVRRLRRATSYAVIRRELAKEGLEAQVRLLDVMNVLLVFDEWEYMEATLEHYMEVSATWSVNVTSLASAQKREKGVCTKHHEVPVQVWHPNTFRATGECWGDFVGVDKSTFTRERFD